MTHGRLIAASTTAGLAAVTVDFDSAGESDLLAAAPAEATDPALGGVLDDH